MAMTTAPIPVAGSGICAASSGHCCHLGSVGVCPYLEERPAGRRWVCTFREELGSWEAVHADPVYLEEIAPLVLELVGVLCGDWPRRGETCAECGSVG